MGWIVKSESDVERVWAEVGEGGAETGVYSVEPLGFKLHNLANTNAVNKNAGIDTSIGETKAVRWIGDSIEQYDRPPIELSNPRKFVTTCTISAAISAAVTVGIVELLRFVL